MGFICTTHGDQGTYADHCATCDLADRDEIHTPDMGWQDCRYVYEGNDPEDGDHYRCTVHGYLTLGHQVSCEGAELAHREDAPNPPHGGVSEPGR